MMATKNCLNENSMAVSSPKTEVRMLVFGMTSG